MNIIEALKSGKRFKRAGLSFVNGTLNGKYTINGVSTYCEITNEDLLADDWVVEDDFITLKERDLDMALLAAYKLGECDCTNICSLATVKDIKENLKSLRIDEE